MEEVGFSSPWGTNVIDKKKGGGELMKTPTKVEWANWTVETDVRLLSRPRVGCFGYHPWS